MQRKLNQHNLQNLHQFRQHLHLLHRHMTKKPHKREQLLLVLRARANNAGNNPLWTSYEKLRIVIEKKMFSNTDDLLPVISFNAKASAEDQTKHEDFVNRMIQKGYTRKQVRLLCEWYLRVRKSS